MSKVELTEIKIKLDKKTITLTPKEAKELKDVLDDFFGKVKYIPSQPIIVEREKWVEPYCPPQTPFPDPDTAPGPYQPTIICTTKSIQE